MKNFTILSAISLLLCFTFSYAQEVAPLKLNNVWIYDYSTHLLKINVVDTNIVIDTAAYYKLESISNYGTIPSYGYARLKEDGFYAFRLDTSYPAPNHEKLYWKKNASVGDTWENYAPDFPLVYTVIDTFITMVFGSSQTVKHLEIDGSIVLLNELWTEKYGLLSKSDFGGSLGTLRGCIINGTVYGDTSFAPVNVEDEFSVNVYYLSQNFPNPFNPVTKIKYSIPQSSFVILKVFDILGNEIEILVNEEKPSGVYEVEFNATNLPDGKAGLSSGIYFYTLTSGNFISTKKLVLLK